MPKKLFLEKVDDFRWCWTILGGGGLIVRTLMVYMRAVPYCKTHTGSAKWLAHVHNITNKIMKYEVSQT